LKTKVVHCFDCSASQNEGTVGDIESAMFLEGLQQMQMRIGKDNFCHVHLG
jgi:CTP synthase (UTP-ammonia lyase)